MPLIVIFGTPPWLTQAESLLQAHGFEPVRYAETGPALVERLVNDYPALLLVDGARPGWAAQVAALKSDQATRRLPVLVIAGEPQRELAHRAGADAVMASDELPARLVDTVSRLARLPGPEALETLACQCRDDLPPLARRAVELFDAGAYYEQHDLFEQLWIAEPGPVRELYRAVLQVGIAYYHVLRGNHAGALRMLRRSVQWFAPLPDVCRGIDVRQLQADADSVRAALEALPPDEIASFDRALLKPIPWIKR